MITFDFTCLDQYLLGLSLVKKIIIGNILSAAVFIGVSTYLYYHLFYLFQLNEQLEILGKDEADPKAREIFHEASRTLEMANPDDLQALGETMFQG